MNQQYTPKILIIDDIRDNLLTLEKSLRGQDAFVLTAQSGKEALIHVTQHDFALIIVDIQMPDMNGYETAERIRSGQRNQHTPIIFLTAVFYDQHSMYKGYQSGAVDYITKPFNRDILLSKVRVFLDLDRVKHELKQAKEEFQHVVQDQTDMICRTDLNLNITFANKAMANFAAKPAEAILGQSVMDWIYNEYHDQIGHEIHALNPNNPVFKLHHRLNLKNDGQLWVSTIFRALYNKNYDLTGYQVVMRDISNEIRSMEELILARKQAEEATRNKSRFLANMSHEIRTPMNSILGLIDVLMETDLDEDQTEDLEVMKHSATKLLELLNDLLDFSKIEANQIRFEKVYFNLRNELNKTFRLLEVNAKKTGNELLSDVHPLVPDRIKGDPLRLGQILINLLNNALKFTRNGRVNLQVEKESETDELVKLKFTISDTGIGMSSEIRENIFNFFEQGDPSISREYGGSGLGLAISRSLCEMMGGKIQFTSEINKGSSFWFSLEFEQEQKTKKSKPQKMNILIVEDNLLNQRVVSATLKKNGYNFDVADNGKIAVEKAQKEKFDVIIMDIQMPVMDGYEATQQIRKNEEHLPKEQRSKIIALTANATREDREKCREIGMDEYMTKPFKFQDLERIIRELME
ncbi:MAG: response regulator [Bacteroidales bacterium]